MAQQKARDGKLQLKVARRAETGSASMKRLRVQGLIPGVVYGKSTEAVPVSVNARELHRILSTKGGEHALVALQVDTAREKPVLVKAIQHDPVSGHALHVDFHAIVLTEELRIKIPVELKGEPVGVKEESGVLEHFMREVEVECLPAAIPDRIEFDVTKMKIGDVIHVRDLPVPPGTKITTDPEGAIASVQEPKVELEEPPAEAEEPEVIGEQKEEEAEGKEVSAEKKGEKEPAKEDKGKKEEK